MSMQFNENARVILESCDVGFDARILENDRYRWLESKDGAVQTVVDFEHRAHIVLPVLQSLVAALAMHTAPQNVLNLGMGGGTLERALHNTRPAMQVTSVEQNTEMVATARRYFFVPRDQDVVIAAADDFLRSGAHRFDVIFCDIFEGGELPACLSEASFYAALRDRLNAGGILATNVRFAGNDALIERLLPLRESFAWVSVHKNEGYDNIALFAARERPENLHCLSAALDDLGNEFDIDFTSLVAGLTELPAKHS